MLTSLFVLLLAVPVMSFAPSSSHPKPVAPVHTKLYNAMERLHDPSTNAFGPLEHVYSIAEIDHITHKIEDDEWMALGSAVADKLLETVLDVCSKALRRLGWVERMSVTNKVADDVSKAVKKSLHCVRLQPLAYDHGHYSIPDELLHPLYKLVRQELRHVSGDESFDCNSENLSLLVASSVGDAIESYLGPVNLNAPFFSLPKEMDHRVSSRRKELLVKHAKGIENVHDVEKDIEESRKKWVRMNLGRKAANEYHFGDIITKVGNTQEVKRRRPMPSMWNALVQDLDGVLIP
jgi:hypothetical protein